MAYVRGTAKGWLSAYDLLQDSRDGSLGACTPLSVDLDCIYKCRHDDGSDESSKRENAFPEEAEKDQAIDTDKSEKIISK